MRHHHEIWHLRHLSYADTSKFNCKRWKVKNFPYKYLSYWKWKMMWIRGLFWIPDVELKYRNARLDGKIILVKEDSLCHDFYQQFVLTFNLCRTIPEYPWDQYRERGPCSYHGCVQPALVHTFLKISMINFITIIDQKMSYAEKGVSVSIPA